MTTMIRGGPVTRARARALAQPLPLPIASWSRAVAAFSVQLVILTILLHRFASLPTPVAMNTFILAMTMASIALILGFVGGAFIWVQGRDGAFNATVGVALSLALFLWPAAAAAFYMRLPRINDVTTDTLNPPPFQALAKARPKGANGVAYAGNAFAVRQVEAYPDVRPVIVPRGAEETHEIVLDVMRRMKWRVVAEEAPSRGKPGLIEAVDRTLILGFTDDVIVRITGDTQRTRIDVRSQSRYGEHDLGQNARRVSAFYKEVIARFDGTGGERSRRRRGSAKVAAEAGPASAAPTATAGPARTGDAREPPRKVKLRSRGEARARDKQ
jgi:uncharacterized protein (DUF1499 family)